MNSLNEYIGISLSISDGHFDICFYDINSNFKIWRKKFREGGKNLGYVG